MNRFFIPPELITPERITIPDDVSAQIRKVLRLKEGTQVQFLDNLGWVYTGEIHYIDNKPVYADMLEKHLSEGEPDCRISLYVGLTQREKFEWILQKCTEAGASEFIPMITERSLIRKPSDINGKQERWEKIIKEASEQCGRGQIPRLSPPVYFQDAAETGSKADIALFCWESEKQKTIHEVFKDSANKKASVALMIGPEGGFSVGEASLALEKQWIPVTLGKRIYRMETAALAAVILSLYETECLL